MGRLFVIGETGAAGSRRVVHAACGSVAVKKLCPETKLSPDTPAQNPLDGQSRPRQLADVQARSRSGNVPGAAGNRRYRPAARHARAPPVGFDVVNRLPASSIAVHDEVVGQVATTVAEIGLGQSDPGHGPWAVLIRSLRQFGRRPVRFVDTATIPPRAPLATQSRAVGQLSDVNALGTVSRRQRGRAATASVEP